MTEKRDSRDGQSGTEKHNKKETGTELSWKPHCKLLCEKSSGEVGRREPSWEGHMRHLEKVTPANWLLWKFFLSPITHRKKNFGTAPVTPTLAQGSPT